MCFFLYCRIVLSLLFYCTAEYFYFVPVLLLCYQLLGTLSDSISSNIIFWSLACFFSFNSFQMSHSRRLNCFITASSLWNNYYIISKRPSKSFCCKQNSTLAFRVFFFIYHIVFNVMFFIFRARWISFSLVVLFCSLALCPGFP